MAGNKEIEEAVLIRARQIFLQRNRVGLVREIAAINGAYDNGTDIQQYIEEAERDVLRAREENIEE